MPRKRKRFNDVTNAPSRPKLIHKLPGEYWYERHQRRYQFAQETLDIAFTWCDVAGIMLTVTNEFHHWRFSKYNEDLNVQWWPSTAKLVINNNYSNGIHTHDILQVIEIVTDVFREE